MTDLDAKIRLTAFDGLSEWIEIQGGGLCFYVSTSILCKHISIFKRYLTRIGELKDVRVITRKETDKEEAICTHGNG